MGTLRMTNGDAPAKRGLSSALVSPQGSWMARDAKRRLLRAAGVLGNGEDLVLPFGEGERVGKRAGSVKRRQTGDAVLGRRAADLEAVLEDRAPAGDGVD